MIIRRLRAMLLLAPVLAGIWLALGPAVATPDTPPLVSVVEAIGITVADMDRSVAFYRDVLGFEPLDDRQNAGEAWDRLYGVDAAHLRVVRMRLGDERIELTQWLTPAGRRMPPDSRSYDAWFQHIAIIVSDMDRAYLWLQRHKIAQISPAPQRLPDWNPTAGGIQAFYFKDPDGHPLELLQFPPDKGLPRWHRPSDRVFLGIDHTAIVVRDTATSVRVYRDALGLRVAGESWNYGIEQERLNDVAGARLHITSLRAAAGPAVELLEYLNPRDGRSLPSDARANDLTHWQTIVTTEVARARAALEPHALAFISRGVTRGSRCVIRMVMPFSCETVDRRFSWRRPLPVRNGVAPERDDAVSHAKLRIPRDGDRVLDALVRGAAGGVHGQRPLGGFLRIGRHRDVVVHGDRDDADGLAHAGDATVGGGGVARAIERDLAPCQGAGKRAVHSAGDAGDDMVQRRGDGRRLRLHAVVLLQRPLHAVDDGLRHLAEPGVTRAVAILEARARDVFEGLTHGCSSSRPLSTRPRRPRARGACAPPPDRDRGRDAPDRPA